MLARIATALLALVVAATPAALPPGPAQAQPAQTGPGLERGLWPYPKACLETELQRVQGYQDEETRTIEIANLLGVSRPCPGNRTPVKGVRLALTQYTRLTKTVSIGWMGSPWRTNSIGETRFRRIGTVADTLDVLCLSTGLKVRRGGVFAEHNRCFRPIWNNSMGGWTVQDVAVDDPVVSVPLQRVPAPGDTAPTACGNCLVTDATTPLPAPVQLPYPGTVASGCARLRLDSFHLGETRTIEVAGTIRACGGDTLDDLAISAVFYGPTGGQLSSPWRLEGTDVTAFARSGGLGIGRDAMCIVSGRRQTDDGSYARHLACLTIRTDAQGRSHVVRIANDDPLVRKPVEIVYTGDPPGTCITCL